MIDKGLSGISITGEAVEETMTAAHKRVSPAPNPTINRFILDIRFKNHKLVEIRVMDIQGSLVEHRLNITCISTLWVGVNYKPGTYFVVVRQGGKKSAETDQSNGRELNFQLICSDATLFLMV